ncbi:MAG TPA: cation-transporting P-type ATPase [Acidothermaceae bacterium]|nr:cation-transporting P-type ATPase [Acidothermaceae bacterium]
MSVRLSPADAEGLTTIEAARRLQEFGPNTVGQPRRSSVLSSVGVQLRDPLILVLLAAAVLTSTTGDFTDAAVIGLVVVVNSSVGVWQELRAQRAIEALSALAAPLARVRRDGRESQIPAEDLAPGDVLVLSEGDIVPADAELLEAHALLIDEAALTGESVPVGKSANPEHDFAISAGTVVVKGRAVAVVTATGRHSALGRIAALLDTGPQATPLQRRLAQLGRVLAGVAVFLCGVVLLLGLLRGQPAEQMVLTSISLVVAAVPESLPAVITLSLALGARQMARRHAIVRRLPAVETLGSVTVLATDKTGTLTTGRMRAEVLHTRDGEYSLIDVPRSEPESGVVDLLTYAALCNDAQLTDDAPPTDDAQLTADAHLGDPTEVALLLAASSVGVDVAATRARWPRVAEIPFDSGRSRMTTIHRADNGFLVCMKGAPEAVLRHCSTGSDDGGFAARAHAQAATLAVEGYRVLAVATARRDRLPSDLEDAERDVALVGLVAIADPPKDNAARTLLACRQAGIRPVLITGDHAATALAIARRVGIAGDDDPAITGQQVAAGFDATGGTVFARIAPEQKLQIVEALRSGGAIVAMVGDGVNDGPALRRADIGVAMGHRGTEVARQAADLVLADDEVATVVSAVEEGRRIYANVRRFLTFGLAGGASEILVMLVGPLLGFSLPLRAAQILWINLLTHGLTGVALGAEPTEPDSMSRPPRPPRESVLGDGLWARVLRLAVVITAVTLGVALWADKSARPWQSMVFVTLTTTQLAIAIGLRARSTVRSNPFLLYAVAGSVALVLAGLYAPPLRELLDTKPLSWTEATLAVAIGVAGWLAIRADLFVTKGRAHRESSQIRSQQSESRR